MRAVSRTLTMAWVEYESTGDGAAFTHICTSRLRFRNVFSSLPRAPGSSTSHTASNAPDSKFVVESFLDHGKKPMRGLLAIPGAGDNELFEEWVNNPAVADGKLVANPDADEQVDLLVLSGHGGGGDVWGDASGNRARISPAHAFLRYDDRRRSGRLKCLITPACTNLNAGLAPLWLAAFKHPQPVHVILGYEDRYSGGKFGARALGKFADLIARNRRMPLIEAWRRANESVHPRLPWAALAAVAGEGLALHDWVRDDLPPLTNAEVLLHFNAEHPDGEDAKLVDEDYEVSWVMGGPKETVIHMRNNYPANEDVGLFAGRRGKIRLRSKRTSTSFKQGQELYLFIYKYRASLEFDINDLLVFDDELLDPHPSTGMPIVKLEEGRISPDIREAATTDAIRIVVPFDRDVIELGFTVKSSATTTFAATGPSGTHGRFLLDFIHRPVVFEHLGRQIVQPLSAGNTFAATTGALLRK